MTTGAAPIAVYRPVWWTRLLPLGIISGGVWAVGVLAIAFLAIGVARVGMDGVMDAARADPGLVLGIPAAYLAAWVAAVVPGLMSRREVRLYPDRVETQSMLGLKTVTREGIEHVSIRTSYAALSTSLRLKYRDGTQASISGWLLGNGGRQLGYALAGERLVG